CPQYIQRRNYRPSSHAETEAVAESGTTLHDQLQQWIASADTLFVASEHPQHGVDASHRGGNPGFLQVLSASQLRIPDYAGNGMFNTLGNFAVNPRAGIIIPDFENGRTLQLTGHVDILWDHDDPENNSGGTRRYWDFHIDRWVQTENALPGSVEFLDYSPHNPGKSA
ncbi:MAG: pyridoxamine 5'-phosphate oxidase family protein, partial [Pirellulales bacterium]|nr:pyridoxamine 5'-phosphate oxidase family protein [Pirellulales bacterium]